MKTPHQILLPVLAIILVTLCAGCTSPSTGYSTSQAAVTTVTPAPTGNLTLNPPTPAVTSVSGTVTVPAGPVSNITVDLVAKKMAFNISTITVPAGAHVTVMFQNQEPSGSSQVAGIPHNFAVYTSQNATTKIFSGEIITGGENITYTFTAPATPGTYYFRCDVHPTIMRGQFIVT